MRKVDQAVRPSSHKPVSFSMRNGSTKTSYLLKSLKVTSVITFILTFVVLFGPAAWAQSKPPLEILAVVLSKTCPLPDSADLKLDSPESIMKSTGAPSCPKQGDIQLIQTAITNRSKASHQVGVEIAVYLGDQPSSRRTCTGCAVVVKSSADQSTGERVESGKLE